MGDGADEVDGLGDGMGVLCVVSVVAFDEDDIGAFLFSFANLGSGLDAKGFGFVAGGDADGGVGLGRNDREGFAAILGMELLLDGREEAVQVDVQVAEAVKCRIKLTIFKVSTGCPCIKKIIVSMPTGEISAAIAAGKPSQPQRQRKPTKTYKRTRRAQKRAAEVGTVAAILTAYINAVAQNNSSHHVVYAGKAFHRNQRIEASLRSVQTTDILEAFALGRNHSQGVRYAWSVDSIASSASSKKNTVRRASKKVSQR